MKNHKCSLVNSCNGLLCLSNSSDNDPVMVCNPITGEYINLPEVRTVQDQVMDSIKSGFGFSPRTNQYKVIRMFPRWSIQDVVMVAEVHVLGTESWKPLQYWKDIQFLPSGMGKLSPIYWNGCVYWFQPGRRHSLLSFDFEKECFELISAPSVIPGNVEIGVLGEELFISTFEYGIVVFWVMKDNGVKKSWSHIFSLEPCTFNRWPYGSYQPITYLNNGALFLYHSQKHAFICKHPEKKSFRYFKLHGFGSKVEAIPHIPSFVSLKNALSGHNVEVLNVKSRCSGLKLHKESKGISIVEDDVSDSSDYQDYESEDKERSMILKLRT